MKREALNFAVQIRSITGTDGALRKIAGTPAVYGQLSEDLGGFREMIAPGAFTKTLQERDVKSFWNHNSDYVIGSSKSGTLSMRDDVGGLYFEATPPDTSWARDAMVSIDRGDVDQMSFGFRTIRDDWTVSNDGSIVRTLLECELYEVSPVALPAYPQTSVNLRDRFGSEDQETIAQAIRLLAGNGGKPAGEGNTAPGSGEADHRSAAHPAAPRYDDLARRLEDIAATL